MDDVSISISFVMRWPMSKIVLVWTLTCLKVIHWSGVCLCACVFFLFRFYFLYFDYKWFVAMSVMRWLVSLFFFYFRSFCACGGYGVAKCRQLFNRMVDPTNEMKTNRVFFWKFFHRHAHTAHTPYNSIAMSAALVNT